jgi:serpin B
VKTTNLDFIDAHDEFRIVFNRWVEERTEEKIKDLLPPESIVPATKVEITNAIYFNGVWAMKFDEEKMRDGDFRTGTKETVYVSLMEQTSEGAVFGYTETDPPRHSRCRVKQETGTVSLYARHTAKRQ